MVWQWSGLFILAVFYSVYIGKMVMQKKRGIQTDQIARGKPKDRLFYIELIMKMATYSVVVVEVISIAAETSALPQAIRMLGLGFGIAGNVIFALAVWTMRDSWRAGIAKNDSTEIVTSGIYKISRNPAFVGFDLVYLGILMLFFNWILFIFTVFAVGMLHLQILQEEKYLPTVFGEKYIKYRAQVGRYFGKL